MDDLVKNYVELAYHEDLGKLIFKAFHLFNLYNYLDYETDYINLLMVEDQYTPEDLHDNFISTVRKQTNFIINSHLVYLTDDATIAEAISIMEFFYNLQELHDYTQLSQTLHSSSDIHEALSLAIEDATNISSHRILSILDSIDPIMFHNLVDYVEAKVNNTTIALPRYSDIGKEIVENMRKYIAFTKRDSLVGATLMDASVVLDQPIGNYSGYIGTFFNDKNDEDLAYNYLSLLYLTKEGIERPIPLYRDSIGTYLGDLDHIASVEQILNKIVADYTTYLEHESKRDKNGDQ